MDGGRRSGKGKIKYNPDFDWKERAMREKMERSVEGDGSVGVKTEYDRWKLTIPVLYDWFTNHSLAWPSLSCRSFFLSLEISYIF